MSPSHPSPEELRQLIARLIVFFALALFTATTRSPGVAKLSILITFAVGLVIAANINARGRNEGDEQDVDLWMLLPTGVLAALASTMIGLVFWLLEYRML